MQISLHPIDKGLIAWSFQDAALSPLVPASPGAEGKLVTVITGGKSKVFEINDTALFRRVLDAIRQDLRTHIGNGEFGGGLTLRPLEAYQPSARMFLVDGGIAAGMVHNNVIKSVCASLYFKGNFSSLFHALRANGGIYLDVHFTGLTSNIYALFDMEVDAICHQDLRKMRPDSECTIGC